MFKEVSRKAQVTVFVIVALVIVVLIALYFIFSGNLNNIPETNGEVADVKSYIDSCIEKTLEQGIYYNGLQGGYYDPPLSSVTYSEIKIPYYWQDNKNLVPEKSKIEQELAKYVDNELSNCINNFEAFNSSTYEISHEVPKSEVKILDNRIRVNINYPISVKKADETFVLEKFVSELDFDFLSKYNYAQQIVDEHENSPNAVPLGFITMLADRNNFKIETIDLDEDVVIYSLIFQEQNDKVYIYDFAAKYDWEDENIGA